jgi:hypothetical protein
MGEWRYSSTFVNLGARGRGVVSVRLMTLYPWGKNPLCPLDRRSIEHHRVCLKFFSARNYYVGSRLLLLTMKNSIFWDISQK